MKVENQEMQAVINLIFKNKLKLRSHTKRLKNFAIEMTAFQISNERLFNIFPKKVKTIFGNFKTRLFIKLVCYLGEN